MIIRQEQLDCLDKEAREEFCRRAEAYIETHSPMRSQSSGLPSIRELVRDREVRAAAFGIDTEAGIVQFACLTLAAGVPIDELDEVRSYLQQESVVPVSDRLAELADFLAAPEAEFVEELTASSDLDEAGHDDGPGAF